MPEESAEEIRARINQAIVTLEIALPELKGLPQFGPVEMMIDILTWSAGRESRFQHVINGFRGVDESTTDEEATEVGDVTVEKLSKDRNA